MISLDRFLNVFNATRGEPEFEFTFEDREDEYMIIKYKDHVTFQRCGVESGSGEIWLASLEGLLDTETIDGVCLRRDWEKVTHIVLNGSEEL